MERVLQDGAAPQRRRRLCIITPVRGDPPQAPAFAGAPPRIVSTSADGTFIHSRDGAIEVKLGLWWTGPTCRARAPRTPGLLHGQVFHANSQDADHFGQTFYALAAEQAGIASAAEVFFISDGAGWLADLPQGRIVPTAMQLDHFHGKLRIGELAKDPERAARWWAWVGPPTTSMRWGGRSMPWSAQGGSPTKTV